MSVTNAPLILSENPLGAEVKISYGNGTFILNGSVSFVSRGNPPIFRSRLALAGNAPLTMSGTLPEDETAQMFASAILTCDECNSSRDANGGPEGYTKSY